MMNEIMVEVQPNNIVICVIHDVVYQDTVEILSYSRVRVRVSTPMGPWALKLMSFNLLLLFILIG